MNEKKPLKQVYIDAAKQAEIDIPVKKAEIEQKKYELLQLNRELSNMEILIAYVKDYG